MLKLYEVKLTGAWSRETGGKSYSIPASSEDEAVRAVLNVEPYYNPQWGITVGLVENGKRLPSKEYQANW